MNELEFRNWLKEKEKKPKVISDCISRLKRIEKELNHCDLDKEYHSDRCAFLLSVFENMGQNDNMNKYPNANLPVGKYYMSTYRHAIKQYVQFLDDITSSN